MKQTQLELLKQSHEIGSKEHTAIMKTLHALDADLSGALINVQNDPDLTGAALLAMVESIISGWLQSVWLSDSVNALMECRMKGEVQIIKEFEAFMDSDVGDVATMFESLKDKGDLN